MKSKIQIFIKYILSIFFLINIYSIEGLIKNFKLPLFSENMENTGNITGSEAEFKKNGIINIKDPEASVLLPELKKVFKFKSEKCQYDKENGTIHTDSFISLSTDGMFIDGKGLKWSFKDNYFTINKSVTMDIEKSFNFNTSGAE